MKYSPLLLLALSPNFLGATSLYEVVQKTIQTHPQIQIKKEDLNVENKKLTKVKADYLLSVDLAYSIGKEETKTIANNHENFIYTRHEASATLTQPLFSGLSTVYGIEHQKAIILSSNMKVKEIANKLAIEAITAYLEVMKNKELLEIATGSVFVHKKYLTQIKEKVENGVGRSSDYKQALSRYENAHSVLYLSEQNYKNSIYKYQIILPDEISDDYLEKPIIGDLPANNLQNLLDIALRDNPAIHISMSDIHAAKASLLIADSSFYPTIDLKLKTYMDKNANGVGVESGSNYDDNSGWNALVVLNYNVFNGFKDKTQQEINQHEILKQKKTLLDVKRYITANTSFAWNTFKSTQKQLIHINKNIVASADTVTYYHEENELGRRNIIDLLNIELEYNSAKNRKVIAEYENLIAYYKILSHTAKLFKVLNMEIKEQKKNL